MAERSTIVFLLLYTTVRANILESSTSIHKSDECYMKDEQKITEIRINPIVLLNNYDELGQEINELRKAMKSAMKSNKWTVEEMIEKSIYDIPNEISKAINKQHKIINLLTHAIYSTSTKWYRSEDRLELMNKIPEVNQFETKTTFDAVFIKQQALKLDKKITDLGRKIASEEKKKIIRQNLMIMSMQFELIFKQKFPENMKIGFDQSTSPMSFSEYYKDIIKKQEQEKLLALIQFIKSNIIFQMSKRINAKTERNSDWFKTLNEKSSNMEIEKYRDSATKIKQINHKQTEILKRAERPKRAIIAIAGKMLLGAFANQAKKLAFKKIKSITANRMKSNEEIIKIQPSAEIKSIKDKIVYNAKDAVRYAEMITEYEEGDTPHNIRRALKKAQVGISNSWVIRDGIIKILSFKDRMDKLKDYQDRQLRYAQSIFNKEIPYELIDSIQGVPQRKCKTQVTIEGTEFVIKYEYYQNIQQVPTFRISTTPFLIQGKAFELDLPKEIIVLEGGTQTIPNPREVCGNDCECSQNTPTYKLNPCLEQVLINKFSQTEPEAEKCAKYIIPSNIKQEKIEKFKQDYFSIFSQTDTTGMIKCKDTKITAAIHRGLNKIEIPYGCKLSTDITQIENNIEPTFIEAMNQKQHTKLDIQKMMNATQNSITQSLKITNYSNSESIMLSIINKQAELSEKINLLQTEPINTNIIWCGSGIILAIIITCIASSVKNKIIATWRKNILICGCCCTIRERDSEKQITEQEMTKIKKPMVKKRQKKLYADLYGSQNSIISTTETEQKPLHNPPQDPNGM